jgi:ArsR family transcriptional regulator, virulence genes transcriptional regulator
VIGLFSFSAADRRKSRRPFTWLKLEMRRGNSMRTRNGLAELEVNAAAIARTLKLFASELRLRVLWRLARAGGELPVATIAANLKIGQSALSQHLAILRRNGVIAARRVGHEIFYRITDTKTAALMVALQEGDLGDVENSIPRPRDMTSNHAAPRSS